MTAVPARNAPSPSHISPPFQIVHGILDQFSDFDKMLNPGLDGTVDQVHTSTQSCAVVKIRGRTQQKKDQRALILQCLVTFASRPGGIFHDTPSEYALYPTAVSAFLLVLVTLCCNSFTKAAEPKGYINCKLAACQFINYYCYYACH
jgi:hypothetical protein